MRASPPVEGMGPSGLDSIYESATLAALENRLERFARTHDPADLWPGLSDDARVRAAREIERVTREVLGGRTRIQLDSGGEHEPYALAVAAHTTGMGPLLGLWADEGRIEVEITARARIANQLAHARRRSARIEREVMPVVDAMLARGAVPVLLKGFHTAHLYFEEPGVRRMSDVDFFVETDKLPAAEEALRACGFRVREHSVWRHKQEWIGPGVDDRIFSVEVDDERSRWVVELHSSLMRVFHPGAVAHLERAHAIFDACDVGGRRVRVLAPAALVMTLACHCSQELDASRLLRLVEIVRVIRSERETCRFSWDEFLGMLESTRAARFAYPALALAEALAPGTIDPRILALGARESTRAARHTVSRLVPAGGSLDELGLLRQVMWMRGPRAVLHRVVRFVWPWRYGSPAVAFPSWRVRARRLKAGLLSLRAPDERRR